MCITRSVAVRRAQAGVTLIELVLFIVIVGVAVGAILGVMSMTTRNSVDPQMRKQALAIAEGMLDEIEGARFTYCDPQDPAAQTAKNPDPYNEDTNPDGCHIPEGVGQEANAMPRPFDNVNDYVAAYNTSTEYTTDAAGNPFPANYLAKVVISQTTGLQTNPGPADLVALRITVTVPYGDKQQVVLDGYRTRYAPNSIP